MITVACVWVQGHVKYGAEYVIRLQAMVGRHLARPHRFVCLTDQPWKFSGVLATIPIAPVHPLPGWWAKLRLFDPLLSLSGRVLYLDLDTLIVHALDPIVDYPANFALIPHAGTFRSRGHLKIIPTFNSSVMVFERDVVADLWTHWSPAVADRLWGDQDFIGEQWPEAATMPLAWFPRLSEIEDGAIPPSAKVILAKKPKPAEAAKRWKWVSDLWKAA